MRNSFFLVAALLVATPAFATPPSSEDALKTINYYFEGAAEGPVLLKSMPCLKIDETKGSKTVNECVEPVVGPVKKGTKVIVWTSWLVPVGGTYDDVVVQVLLGGVVRETKDLKLSESVRMRTWSTTTLSKSGTWEMKILRGPSELAWIKVVVE